MKTTLRPGSLVYVMGPSGAGKDSLLRHARASLEGNRPVVFAHRYITRPLHPGENHVALTHHEFALRRRHDCFALHWRSHGNEYGVGREIDGWMAAGLTVVVNGSRAYFPEALKRYPDLLPVLVTVDAAVLRQRMVDRGRETGTEIERRLASATAFECGHPRLHIIDNTGALDLAGTRFREIILSEGNRVKE
ncbi:MAG: phosphonate metabolism protein/1,5-bisphosphokinase (PRPP-forming) PhnN [Alphaproteobacteria bacterium]